MTTALEDAMNFVKSAAPYTHKNLSEPHYIFNHASESVVKTLIAALARHTPEQAAVDARLLEAVNFARNSIQEAVNLSAVYNGHTYNFKPCIEKLDAAIAAASGYRITKGSE
jgi:hypothetical protein